MLSFLQKRWSAEAGYRQILKVAFPLILSTGSVSIMLFVDRMLLSWASTDYIAAALPAGILNWALLCPFFGTAAYASTFVAQYIGAGKNERVGAAIWHGLYISLIGGLLMPLLALFSDQIFAAVGHAPRIQKMESDYFSILNFASIFFLVNAVFSCFYAGRGRAWTIVWLNVCLTFFNTLFDYAFIFGKFGFPVMGIKGAGYASFLSAGIVTALYAILVLSKNHERNYHTRSGWKFDAGLFRRMLKFGFPSGMHFFLDVIGMTVFMLIVGRLGVLEGAANNITHQIHLLGLLPLIGLGIANGILVGQYQGSERSDLAEKSTYSSLQLAFIYNGVVSAAYLLIPSLFISPFFFGRAEPASPELIEMIKTLLVFVAIFTLFESLVIVSSGTLKGAGDTSFVMRTLAFTSFALVIAPTVVVIEILNLPVFYAWGILAFNLMIVGLVFFGRFRAGRWKSQKVID